MLRTIVIIELITLTFAQITLPPFRQISHDIQSGPIEVTNNDTITIPKFYFDGKAPRAHFWVGKGQPSTNGTLVPFQNDTGTLPIFSNTNVTLKLPNITIHDIDYLSVWCEAFEVSLGHVFMNERWVRGKNGTGMILPKTIGPFRKTIYDVSSGNVRLLDEKKIFIPKFSYNGKGIPPQFWVGKGSPSPSGKLAIRENGDSILSKENQNDITVTLPDNFTVTDFDYLAVWDGNNISYGHVFFNDTPTDMEMYIGIEFPGFENKQYGLKTGPIIVANKNTLYITNFHYRGYGNEYFWTGSKRRPTEDGLHVANQIGLEDNIKEDAGSSFYLNLPNGFPEKEEIYFGIWDQKTKGLIANITFVGENKVAAETTVDGRRIIRYPKCCPHGQMMHDEYCVPTDLLLDSSIPVHYANSTHLNDDPMIFDRVMFVPYLNMLTCDRYFLDHRQEEDKFLYLTSGTLLVPGHQAHYRQDDFCLDIIESDEVIYHGAFICYTNNDTAEGIRIAICICVLLSAICLLITAATFFIVTDREDMRGASVAGFAGFMGIAFIFLFITQVGLESKKWCNTLGFFFQFFIVSSLIWLDALCYEMYYNIKNYNNDSILGNYKTRISWYFAVAVLFPLLFVIISLAFSIPVGLINVNLDRNCLLDASNKKWLLYSPILLTIVIAIGLTVYNYQSYYNINRRVSRNEGRKRDFWIFTKSDIKTRLMLCVFLVVFTSLCWIFEIVTYAFESSWEPLDILHALQGVFTMIIVLSTGQVWKKLVNRLCGHKPSGSTVEMQPMNNNGGIQN